MSGNPLRLPAAVRSQWELLAQGQASPPLFSHGLLEALPEPAPRWLARSIPPGTPLWSSIELEMTGEIRLGTSWHPFRARQILAPVRGFIWTAATRVAGIPVKGFDRFTEGIGQMRWRLLNVVPIMTAEGPDITRSAAGRLAAESILIPPAFQSATWTDGPSDNTMVMSRLIDGSAQDVQLRIDRDGRLAGAIMQRWGTPGGAAAGRYPFGVDIEKEGVFSGVAIPAVLRAGWWWGTDRQDEGEFFRARITSATFR